MGYYHISTATVNAEIGIYQDFNRTYATYFEQYVIQALLNMTAFGNILGEIGSIVSNIAFVLGKIPGGPNPTSPTLGAIIPVEKIITPAVKLALSTVSASAGLAAGLPGLDLNNVEGAILNSAGDACATSCSFSNLGDLSKKLDRVMALLNSVQAPTNSAGSAAASAASAAAKFDFSIPQPTIISVGEPPPPPMDPSPFDAISASVLSQLLSLAQQLDNMAVELDNLITGIHDDIRNIKNEFTQIYETMRLIKSLSLTSKKAILRVTKIIIALERALKFIALSIFTFFLPTPWAAQMAAWFGVIGEAMAGIEGLLNKALAHLGEAESAVDASGQARTEQELQMEGIKQTLSAAKTAFKTAITKDLFAPID